MPNNVFDSGLWESRKLTKPLYSGNRERKKTIEFQVILSTY